MPALSRLFARPVTTSVSLAGCLLVCSLLFFARQARAQQFYPQNAPVPPGQYMTQATPGQGQGGQPPGAMPTPPGPGMNLPGAGGPMGAPGYLGGPQWLCAGEPAPPGQVITATGPGISCAGVCNGRYAEPLRLQMVICQGQPIPEGYEVVEEVSSARCDCVASADNALVIRLKPSLQSRYPGFPIGPSVGTQEWNQAQ